MDQWFGSTGKKVLAYSIPLVTIVSLIGEQSLRSVYTTPAQRSLTRFLENLINVGIVIAISQKVYKEKEELLEIKHKDFLERWGHCTPYHSSLQDSAESLSALIVY